MKTANAQNGKEVNKIKRPYHEIDMCAVCRSFEQHVGMEHGRRKTVRDCSFQHSTYTHCDANDYESKIAMRIYTHAYANDGEIVVDCVVCFCFFLF